MNSDDRTEPTSGVYVILAETPNGGEDIAGLHTSAGWMPLVCTDAMDPAMFFEAARRIARLSGRTLRLVHFTHREVIREIEP